VNRKLNKWYDWGEGKGGNIVDLGVLMHQCSISDFLQKLEGPGILVQQHQKTMSDLSLKEEEANRIQILSIHHITSYPLVKYLRTRRIAADIADKYCQETRYKMVLKTMPEAMNCATKTSKEAALQKTLHSLIMEPKT
jgi:hypothetical protein